LSAEIKRNNRMSNLIIIFKEPVLFLTILSIFAAIFIFVLFPLLKVLILSFTTNEGTFSLQTFGEIVSKASFRKTFMNSMKLGAITAVLASVVGYIFAYATTRTNIPLKGFFKMIATLPIISPPFVLSLSMIFLFGRMGIITNGLFGIDSFNIYGLHSLVVIQVMSFFPIAYLTLTGILEAIDPAVEDAALNLGASRWQIFKSITLPLSMPGIVSAVLLVFIQSLEDFSNPAVIGGNYSTLAVEAYRVITGMYELKSGAVLAILLLLPTLIAYLLQKYWISGKSFVTVTGKPSQNRPKISDRHIVIPLFVVCLLFTGIIILFYGTVLFGAFVKVWGVNNTLTFDHFKYVFSLGWEPLKNSIIIAAIVTPVTGILGMIIAYLVMRKEFIGKHFMEFSSMLTFALPGTVVGIGYILAFNDKPFLLTGTLAILVIALTFRNMPVGIEAGTSALQQIDKSIEEASTNLGASSSQTFKKITLPLIKQAFFSGLVFAFVRAMTAVSSIIFLISARWNLATAKIFSLFEVSKFSDAAAYIIIMITVIMTAIGVLNLLVSRIGSKHKERNVRG
jgi:iron(III) transport system permease protein